MDALRNFCLYCIIILSFVFGCKVFITFHGHSSSITKYFAASKKGSKSKTSKYKSDKKDSKTSAPVYMSEYVTSESSSYSSVSSNVDFFDSLYKNGMNKCCYEACKAAQQSKRWKDYQLQYSFILQPQPTKDDPLYDPSYTYDPDDPCRCQFLKENGLKRLNEPGIMKYDQCMDERSCCTKACDAQYGKSVIDSTDTSSIHFSQDPCSCVLAEYREKTEATEKGIYDVSKIENKEGGVQAKEIYWYCFRKSVRPQCCGIECKNRGYELRDADGTLNYAVDTDDDNCKCRVDGTWINLGITGQYTKDYAYQRGKFSGKKHYLASIQYGSRPWDFLDSYQRGTCIGTRRWVRNGP